MSRRIYPNLPKAPIVEALIDFRVSGVSESAIERLLALRSEVSAKYPKWQEVHQMEARIPFEIPKDDRSIVRDRQLIGYRLTSADGKYVAMMTMERFTVSRLQPYERWESIRDEARRLWDLYRKAVEPETVSRVALRYINRLELPADLRDFRDYLTAPPEVPPRLSQTLQSFLTRITIPLPHVGGSAVVTQQMEPWEQDAQFIVILLDIDVFKVVQFPESGQEAWELADSLRNEKNMIFFESITEQMEELCT